MKRKQFLTWLAAGLPIAALAGKQALAAITRENGHVTSIGPDTVAITGNPTQFQVNGGIPAPCNSVGSSVSFEIDLADREPIATNVVCEFQSPPRSDDDGGDAGDAAGGDGGGGGDGAGDGN